MDYAGSCHCGAISLSLHSAKQAEQLGARKCGCSFCKPQDAAWTSDREGRLEITTTAPYSRYRFGTKTADFLVCGQCGVVPAVLCEIDGHTLGVVRVNCLTESALFLAHCQSADYDGEEVEARLARRLDRWTPAFLKDAA
jgi:hypothetical protein